MSSLDAIANPFHKHIVNDPWEPQGPDVQSIHKAAFARCCQAMGKIWAGQTSTSVLVYGEAGSGKTHLLARLRNHIARQAEVDGPGGLQEAIFVAVRMQTGPRTIWRHLRQNFAGDLLRRSADGQTQLERLLLQHLIACGFVKGDAFQWLAQRRQTADGLILLADELPEMFETLDPSGRIGFDTRTVLTHLLLRRHRAEAAAWLRGASLPEDVLRQLGVGSEYEEEEQEKQAEKIIFDLCELATAELPIVFCFDQIEALQVHAQDGAGLFALGQMIGALHDGTRHALLITCVQFALADIFQRTIRDANWHRMVTSGVATLNPLTWEEAKQLIKARLDALPELKALRVGQSNPIWPLQETEVRPVFTETGCPARKLITHCADLFELARQTATLEPVPTTEEFLDKTWETYCQQTTAKSDPEETSNIIKNGLPRLVHLARKDWRQQTEDLPRDIDLLFTGPEGRVALSVCNNTHGNSTAQKLRRLTEQQQQAKYDKLIVIRDQRRPLTPTATVARGHREKLLAQGAVWFEPPVPALAALAALQQLLAETRSGDLANHGDTVPIETVEDWLIATLTSELKDLLEEVTKPPVADPFITLREGITNLLNLHHVVSVEDAVFSLGYENAQITECVLQSADRFGWLGEPPTVLFQLVNNHFNA